MSFKCNHHECKYNIDNTCNNEKVELDKEIIVYDDIRQQVTMCTEFEEAE